MDIPERVEAFLASQPEPKQTDLRLLHARILEDFPECRLWFDDGTNDDGKVVANPNIGYGMYTITYANGSSREFYRIGLSANTTGISVYVLGLDDKTYLTRTYGASIGKASVTGYCIKFKRLSNQRRCPSGGHPTRHERRSERLTAGITMIGPPDSMRHGRASRPHSGTVGQPHRQRHFRAVHAAVALCETVLGGRRPVGLLRLRPTDCRIAAGARS